MQRMTYSLKRCSKMKTLSLLQGLIAVSAATLPATSQIAVFTSAWIKI